MDRIPSRRRFLQVGSLVGVGFALGFGCSGDAASDPRAKKRAERLGLPAPEPRRAADGTPVHAIDAYIAIAENGAVELSIPEAEMGQGILTGLAMILADELETPWDTVSVKMPDADERYGNQSTGGSTSVRGGHDALRSAAAAVREMLVAAAATRWGVDVRGCVARDGQVAHPDHGTVGYGELAADAASLSPPDEPTLKPVSERRLPGTNPLRLDLPDKVDGVTTFGLDVRLPGMRYARVATAPTFGGSITGFGSEKARAVPGVEQVVEIPGGVAVVATNTWAAEEGRKALELQLDPGPHATLDDDAITAACIEVIDQGEEAFASGDVEAALASATVLEAEYAVPYLAHATMEPMNCTVRVDADAVEVWAPTQSPTRARQAAAEASAIDPAQVVVHSTFMGGGFGRRSQPDYVAEAVHVAKALSGTPVQTSWSREDDTRRGWYRPVSVNRFRGAVGPDGLPIAWEHRIATPSILAGMGRTGIDSTSIEGAANLPYAIPAVRVTCAAPDLPIPLWFWRSVGSSQNAYVTECFLDELAALGKRDPVEVRMALLGGHPRHVRALQKAVDMSGYGKTLPEGHAMGVAVHESFGSICAQVAEVSLDGDTPRVHTVWVAIDCGQVIHPDSVAAQMESSVAYGLSAALYGRISVKGGAAVQGNFHDYRVLRIGEMPRVETAILAEGEPFGGIGEPGTPPIAPAVCNALRALRGEPVRSLPVLA
jgi:isoquinoline 1-oxidoreductase beta subunit